MSKANNKKNPNDYLTRDQQLALLEQRKMADQLANNAKDPAVVQSNAGQVVNPSTSSTSPFEALLGKDSTNLTIDQQSDIVDIVKVMVLDVCAKAQSSAIRDRVEEIQCKKKRADQQEQRLAEVIKGTILTALKSDQPALAAGTTPALLDGTVDLNDPWAWPKPIDEATGKSIPLVQPRFSNTQAQKGVMPAISTESFLGRPRFSSAIPPPPAFNNTSISNSFNMPRYSSFALSGGCAESTQIPPVYSSASLVASGRPSWSQPISQSQPPLSSGMPISTQFQAGTTMPNLVNLSPSVVPSVPNFSFPPPNQNNSNTYMGQPTPLWSTTSFTPADTSVNLVDSNFYHPQELLPSYSWNCLEVTPSYVQDHDKLRMMEPTVKNLLFAETEVPTFSGITDPSSPVEFIRRIELHLIPACKSDDEKSGCLRGKLVGEPAAWINDIPRSIKYRHLRHLFLERYYDQQRQNEEWSNFISVVRFPEFKGQTAELFVSKWLKRLQFNKCGDQALVMRYLAKKLPNEYASAMQFGFGTNMSLHDLKAQLHAVDVINHSVRSFNERYNLQRNNFPQNNQSQSRPFNSNPHAGNHFSQSSKPSGNFANSSNTGRGGNDATRNFTNPPVVNNVLGTEGEPVIGPDCADGKSTGPSKINIPRLRGYQVIGDSIAYQVIRNQDDNLIDSYYLCSDKLYVDQVIAKVKDSSSIVEKNVLVYLGTTDLASKAFCPIKFKSKMKALMRLLKQRGAERMLVCSIIPRLGRENDHNYYRNLEGTNSGLFYAAGEVDNVYFVPIFDRFTVSVGPREKTNRHLYFDNVGKIKFQPKLVAFSKMNGKGEVLSLDLNENGYRLFTRAISSYMSNESKIRAVRDILNRSNTEVVSQCSVNLSNAKCKDKKALQVATCMNDILEEGEEKAFTREEDLPFYVPIQMKNVEIEGLVDEGCPHVLLDQSVYEELVEKHPELKKAEFPAQGETFYVPCVIVKGLNATMLLGRQWRRLFRVATDDNEKKIKLSNPYTDERVEYDYTIRSRAHSDDTRIRWINYNVNFSRDVEMVCELRGSVEDAEKLKSEHLLFEAEDRINEKTQQQAHLDPEKRRKLLKILLRHRLAFRNEIGTCKVYTHKLIVKDLKEMRSKSRPLNRVVEAKFREVIRDWLKSSIVVPSDSPYRVPLLPVEKKNGTFRPVLVF
ncbi:hypothetical protein U1Q18_047824 [Sarracenia purpurea var. burkii]